MWVNETYLLRNKGWRESDKEIEKIGESKKGIQESNKTPPSQASAKLIA